MFLHHLGDKDTCNGNIVNCDYNGNYAILVARILFTLTIVSGAAFNLMPLRDNIILTIWPEEDLNKTSNSKIAIFTVILLVVPFGIASFTENILSVIGIMGALFNPFMMYILPCT